MKVALVIDIDDNTEIEDYDVRVWLYNNTTGLEKWYQKVQLKPMPERFEPTVLTDYCLGNADGWNACVDEILGGNE